MSHTGLLVTIDLLSGHNISASDIDDNVQGTSQVYCVFAMNDEEWKSQVIDDLNPVWNEACTFTLSALDIPYNQVISLKVFDQDKYTSDDSLGHAKFVLTKDAMEARDVIETTLVLEDVPSGEVKISISFGEAEEGAKKVNVKAKKERKIHEKAISYSPLQGSVYPPSDFDSEIEASLPTYHPEILFTYGYSGKDTRDNVFYNVDGNLVYFTGQLGIIYDTRTKEQQFFTGHNDDILSLAIHPRGVSVATGQVPTLKGTRKPKICIWNSKNPDKSMTIEDFHTHGIHTLKFSSSGNFLLSIGSDSNNTMVYSEWKAKRQVATISGGKSKVEGCAFHPSDDNKFVTYGDKHILFWELSNGRLSSKKGVFGKVEPNNIITAFYLDDETVITGDSAGLIVVWKNRTVGNAMRYHKGPVGSIQPFLDGIISGCHEKMTYWVLDQESGKYKIIKSSTVPFQTNAIAVSGNELCVGTSTNGIFMIENFTEESEPLHITQSHTDEMWGLSVSSSNFFLSSGYDGSVVMIDHEDRSIINHNYFEGKIYCIDLNPSDDTFAVGLESGKVLTVSVENFEIKQELEGSNFRVSCVKYSAAGNRLAVARKNKIDVYTLQGEELVLTGSCIGHSGVITHMTWSEDGEVIQSDSNSYEHLYWNLEDLTQVTESSLVRDVVWYKWGNLLGWPVIGIWPEGADGTDINSVRFSNSQEYVITGDDDNYLKIFNYPVNTTQAPFHLGVGHCSHVTNCSFTADDLNIITLGGASSTVIQWRLDDSPVEIVKTEKKSKTQTPKKKSQTPKKTKTQSRTKPRRDPALVKKNPLVLKLDDLLNTGKIGEDAHSVVKAILADTKKEKIKAALTQMGRSDSSKNTTATTIMDIINQ